MYSHTDAVKKQKYIEKKREHYEVRVRLLLVFVCICLSICISVYIRCSCSCNYSCSFSCSWISKIAIALLHSQTPLVFGFAFVFVTVLIIFVFLLLRFDWYYLMWLVFEGVISWIDKHEYFWGTMCAVNIFLKTCALVHIYIEHLFVRCSKTMRGKCFSFANIGESDHTYYIFIYRAKHVI